MFKLPAAAVRSLLVSRLAALLAVSALFLGAAASQAAEIVNTAAYGRYGNVRKQGANWLYTFSRWNDDAYTTDLRLTMTQVATKVKMGNGTDQIATRILEETGTMVDGRIYGLETIQEYWKTSGQCVYLGSDRVKRDGSIRPLDRLGRGMVIPRRMRVGETVKSTDGFYEQGKFLGKITYSIKLLDRKPVLVPAGYFKDCIHLRISIQAGELKQVADEWWAKGVGMVKRRGRGDSSERHDLVAYNLKGDHLTAPGQFRVASPNSIKSSGASGTGSKHDRDMNFSATPIGGISPEEKFTVTNIGSTPLVLHSSISEVGRAFVISNLSGMKTLLPGEVMTFGVSFVPPADSDFAYGNDYEGSIYLDGGFRGGFPQNMSINLRGTYYAP